MEEFSVLIGGKAGYGIDRSAFILGRLLNRAGWRIYIYRDYPSLIRGGHTFAIIRAAGNRINAHRDRIDFLLALNAETLSLHQARLADNATVIYDADAVREPGLPASIRAWGLPIGAMLREEKAPEVMRNTCMLGAFAKAVGIPEEIIETVLKENFPRETELNIKVSRRAFAAGTAGQAMTPPTQAPLPLISGSEAIGLGLIQAGLQDYVAYPMTPSTPLLHFLAEQADTFSLKVIHPESEIGVILMALGFAYAGEKAAVGTSGGGFCLMTESVSLAGMSELPVVIVLGQRPGPSTGLPTYSGQGDLQFALHAGQGEFVRFVVAPGDLEEACSWAFQAMTFAWKYQIPAILLTDKNLNEGLANFDPRSLKELEEVPPPPGAAALGYRRYADSETGISPFAFPPLPGAVIKTNSYEHDESGITTEDIALTRKMQDKRLRKERYLREELKRFPTVKTYGKEGREGIGLVCWGSTKGVCVEAAGKLGWRVIQPLVLSPFPDAAFREAVRGIKKLIVVENNATGQLAQLLKTHGIQADEMILKYDGRPFALEELETKLKEVRR